MGKEVRENDQEANGNSKNKVTPENVLCRIAENYQKIEQSIVSQLTLQVPNHGPTAGSNRETVWKSLLEMIIPKKYQIAQGVFIIDSYGGISQEVDLAVYDEMYTPYIFNYGEIKFIPIEAVGIVVQCKSTINKAETCKNLETWVKSIDKLKASMDAVSRFATGLIDNSHLKKIKSASQTSTRPIQILCAMEISCGKKKINKMFDIVLSIKGNMLHKYIGNESNTLAKWSDTLNHYELGRYREDEKEYRDNYKMLAEDTYKEKRDLTILRVADASGCENTVMSLTFQLNQLLMLINNPMLFPHHAYAKLFSDMIQGKTIAEREVNADDER